MKPSSDGSTGWPSVTSPNRRAKRDLLIGREVLIGEEQHEVLEPRRADGRDDVVVERLRDVDAAYLGADRGADPLDVELRRSRHGNES